MKQILLGTLALLALSSSGCKRSDSTTVKLPANGWVINGNTYTTADATCFNGRFAAGDSFSNYATVNFYETPNLDKVYKIVDGDKLQNLAPDEVVVGLYNGDYFYSTKSSKMLTLKMTGGRVNVSVPEIWLKNDIDNDSIRFAAQMAETR